MDRQRIEDRLRLQLRLEAGRARVSPDAWHRVRSGIERPVWPRRIVLAAAAAALIAAAVIVPRVVLDRQTVTDVAASPEPTPFERSAAADEALRCFFEVRIDRDLERARPCMTERFAATFSEPLRFMGASSPNVVRFTIIRDLERTEDRLRVLARAYEGTSTGLLSYSDDTFTVARVEGSWGVDGWDEGPEIEIRETEEIDIYLLRPDPEACSRSVDLSKENPGRLIPIERQVLAGDDVPLRAMQELLMGLREEDLRADPLFWVDARVHSVRVSGEAADVIVNEAALRHAGSCPSSILRDAIELTMRQFAGLREVRISTA